MEERSCATCGFEPAPRTTTVCTTCLASTSKPHWKKSLTGGVLPGEDEERIDIIGQNGNEGLHYDVVSNPKHYQVLPGVEVIDIRRALLEKIDALKRQPSSFAVNCWDRALEYTIRAWEKNGVEDLKKAAFYLDKCIKEFELK